MLEKMLFTPSRGAVIFTVAAKLKAAHLLNVEKIKKKQQLKTPHKMVPYSFLGITYVSRCPEIPN